LARRASLQGEANIQTPQALFNWCENHVKSFFVFSHEILINDKWLTTRFLNAKKLEHSPIIRLYLLVNLLLKQGSFLQVTRQKGF
jgi:hypothetical protein